MKEDQNTWEAKPIGQHTAPPTVAQTIQIHAKTQTNTKPNEEAIC